MVLGISDEEIHSDLWEAVRLGLIVRLEGSYEFLHDRVQEAAYALIPEGERAEAHLRIGRLLAAHTPAEELEEDIFEIVNQLNRGAALITSRDEREQLAELNLIAGKRAKASTAYASALTYLAAGRALLPEDSWERRYELTFALEYHRAECELLTGDLAAAEERLIDAFAAAPRTRRHRRRRVLAAGRSTRPLVGATAALRYASNTSSTCGVDGRRIRRRTRSGTNTSGSGNSSGPARSRSSSTCR